MTGEGERKKITEEAAIWLVRMEHDASPQTQAGFDRWLRQGALNAQEYLPAKAAWTHLHGLDASLRFSAAEERASVIALPAERADSRTTRVLPPDLRRPRTRRVAAIAAGIVIVLGCAVFAALWSFERQSYATASGRQESIPLADGSVMHLNTHSRARVKFSDEMREVLLVEGEALFSVAHDAARPFVVVAGGVRVRALGTQFNVYRSHSGIRVAVVEGLVQVTASGADVQLKAGEEARVERGRIVRPEAPNIQRAVAWRARRLMFDDIEGARVDEIADEFNRYNRVQIHVEGEALRARRMGGTFDADDPAPFIGFLSKDPAVIVEESGSQILIRPRAAR